MRGGMTAGQRFFGPCDTFRITVTTSARSDVSDRRAPAKPNGKLNINKLLNRKLSVNKRLNRKPNVNVNRKLKAFENKSSKMPQNCYDIDSLGKFRGKR